ncbi:MAG: hypothetical protein UY72_C0004G0005 [Candidatus Uhrbacteria bacterium GW2011_GWD2_52_7]|uniref:Uncharacterized protein n=1 Tax=Candidatus Uhrbacteria bacterium GW2011_GWD2_52_7 TaxID=1618989 RepID=A0A0G1XIE0_9BACT|nr:MAG: hypothetical protein UY72_C0004G0005 [Candidatus Uhrbacteria bacterium GW2011_GWD2_52_7]
MAGMLLNLALHSPALGTVAFTAWCIAATHRVASLFQPNSKLLSYFLSALICASTLTLGSLLVYFTLPLNAVSVGGLLTLLTFALLRLPNPQALSFAFPTFGNVPREIIAILVLFQSVILAFLIAARTSEPLVSPWTLLPGSIFVLFFVSTALTLYVQHRGTSTALLFAVVQLFLAVSVSAIVYGIGFGFDPFVHRAGETALITTGHIEPVSILYSGQYALVGALHFLTQLSVTFVDMWLLPLFASIFPPLAAYVGLRHGWNIDERVARFGWVATLFIPFMLFTFTVPFTVTYVFFAGALFLFPLAQTTKSAAILILAATTMCFFHPLLAVPTLLLFAASWLAHRLSLWVSVASFVVLTALCVPALLFVYQMGNGVSIDFSNLVWNVTAFLSLFANPFGSYDPRITFSLNSLYTLRYWQPVVTLLLMLALAPFWTTHRKHVALLVAFVVGMLLCTYGVSTLFTFKGIISHEQHEFALRLLQAIYIIPICLIPVALSRWQHHALMRTLWFVGMSVFATTSWYFSYPQFNAKFAYYSPSVSRHDVDAVHFMETDSAGNPYVVLSNQMTSAAALQEFGFAHYHALAGEEILWYAIPTGGTLYAYYLNIISSGNTEPAQELMESANVDTVYLVMYAYWPGSSQLIHQLEVQSSHIESINDRITIYKLNRYE